MKFVFDMFRTDRHGLNMRSLHFESILSKRTFDSEDSVILWDLVRLRQNRRDYRIDGWLTRVPRDRTVRRRGRLDIMLIQFVSLLARPDLHPSSRLSTLRVSGIANSMTSSGL